MRTTIDIPDELFRQVKSRAAIQGVKLKEFFTQALHDSLFRHEPASEVREPANQYDEDILVLREDCVFPFIQGETSDEMRSITDERLARILEDEDASKTDTDNEEAPGDGEGAHKTILTCLRARAVGAFTILP